MSATRTPQLVPVRTADLLAVVPPLTTTVEADTIGLEAYSYVVAGVTEALACGHSGTYREEGFALRTWSLVCLAMTALDVRDEYTAHVTPEAPAHPVTTAVLATAADAAVTAALLVLSDTDTEHDVPAGDREALVRYAWDAHTDDVLLYDGAL